MCGTTKFVMFTDGFDREVYVNPVAVSQIIPNGADTYLRILGAPDLIRVQHDISYVTSTLANAGASVYGKM